MSKTEFEKSRLLECSRDMKTETAMQIYKKSIEQPWAVPKKPGFKGEASGLYFWHYRTREEAEKGLAWLKRKKKWHGPIEYRPGESWLVGHI